MDIDLTSFVKPVQTGEPQMSAEPAQYTLTAIILHRGSSASSGHYVSIVKDERSGTWWKYDDDSVTNMGMHPFKGAKWDPVSGDGEANGATGVKKSTAKKKLAGKVPKAAPKASTNGAGGKAQGGKGGMTTRGGKRNQPGVIQIEEASPVGMQDLHVSPVSPAPPAALVVEDGTSYRRKRSLADVSDSAPASIGIDILMGDSEAVAAKRICSIQRAAAAACSSPGDVQICAAAAGPAAVAAGTVGGDADTAGESRAAMTLVHFCRPVCTSVHALHLILYFFSYCDEV
jgi:hypothetical protein